MKTKVIAYTNEISRDEWLDLRRTGIGGSDASVIMGANKYHSTYSLWADKKGLTTSNEAGDAAKWGNRLERTVAEAFAEETGAAVVAWPVMLQGERDWQLANVDFFVVEPNEFAEAGKVTDVTIEPIQIYAILEIKTTGISGKGNAKGWANNAVPKEYFWQGAHYALTTGVHKVFFACLIGGEGLAVREVNYTSNWLDPLYEAELDFWNKVQIDDEPPVSGHEADFDTLKEVYPASEEGRLIEVDGFVKDLVEEFRIAKQQLDDAQADLDLIKAQLLRIAEGAESVAYDGEILYTYKSTKTGETLDAKALKESMPDLYKQFTKEKSGYRVLRIKGE